MAPAAGEVDARFEAVVTALARRPGVTHSAAASRRFGSRDPIQNRQPPSERSAAHLLRAGRRSSSRPGRCLPTSHKQTWTRQSASPAGQLR
jgi:hypothetical protein